MIDRPYEVDPITAVSVGGEVVAVNRRHSVFVDSGARYILTGAGFLTDGSFEINATCTRGPGEGTQSRFLDSEFRFYRA